MKSEYEQETGVPAIDEGDYGCPDFHTSNYVEWLEAKAKALWDENHRLEKVIKKAIALGFRYGCRDGEHHKQWVIDQMLRELASKEYERFVKEYEDGEDGPKTYEWDKGIAP